MRKDECLKLWTLEERRNRQDLIEVCKICNGLSRIRLNELFTLDDNIKGTRGHSWKLGGSINAFKGCLDKIRETRMGFYMD